MDFLVVEQNVVKSASNTAVGVNELVGFNHDDIGLNHRDVRQIEKNHNVGRECPDIVHPCFILFIFRD